jgi:peroxiredoxin
MGESAPEISAVDLNDAAVKLSDFRGKVVVLRFWITGCKACIAEMPLIEEISKRHGDRGLAVLAINVGDSKEKVEKFAKMLNISYLLLLDPARIAVGKYGIRAVPTTIIIDRRGIAVKRMVGEMPQELLEKTVVEML